MNRSKVTKIYTKFAYSGFVKVSDEPQKIDVCKITCKILLNLRGKDSNSTVSSLNTENQKKKDKNYKTEPF